MSARTLTLAIALGIALTVSGHANDAVQVAGAWVRAVPPSSPATAAYFTIRNPSAAAVQLVGGSCKEAESTEPMITTRRTVDGQEVIGMETVKSVEIPAGESRVFEPGGDHLMLMGLKAPLVENSEIEITLVFQPGDQKIQITAPVLREAPAE